VKAVLEKFLESTHDAIIAIDTDCKIILFNKSAERLTKKDASKVIGQDIRDVIVNTRLPLILETGVNELNRKQPLDDINIITNRMIIRDDNGNTVSAIAVFRDISEYVELAEEITNLKDMKVMLEAIFDSTEDAISVVDEKGQGMMINPAYTRLTGFTSKDIIGKVCTMDLSEGESVHLEVLRERKAVKNVRMRVGPMKKDVIVDGAPIIVNGVLKGSVAAIHDITEISKLNIELDRAKRIIRNLEAKYTFEDIIGESEIFNSVIEKAKLAASTPATVIIRGESGTGKELFAHAIHNQSERKNAQFIRVNCGAISENILESELFGYEEGSFTGALKGGKAGYFEMADGGTIFLDEIGEIALSTQVKLLRVLQEKEVLRVGSSKPVPIDVRIISATNADLENAIKENKFRKDLYYRLNVFPIKIPSLKNHKDDIHLLVDHLIKKFNQEYGKNVIGISDDALELIHRYDWPGNVRELENFIGRAIINMGVKGGYIDVAHLPKLIVEDTVIVEKSGLVINKLLEESDVAVLDKKIQEFEKSYLEMVLAKNNGNRTKTAKVLDISIRNLYYKMKKYNIKD
jgi:PAS domain S-box-containing protein